MSVANQAPRILELGWGRVRVAGQDQVFKDVKLFPGGARAWDWGETGTRHSPGIQPEDVQELLDHGARVIILSQGVYRRLRVSPATLQKLASLQIEVHTLPTEEAVALYNQLCDQQPVGALIHSTC